jgi:hypothetical protein
VRRELDFYETAAWQVDALVDHLPELSGSIWCPCVGDGSLMRRLKERRPDLGPFVTNDIDPAREADMHYDATNLLHWHWMRERFGRPDWVVDNFPFDVEIDIVKHAYETARQGVVAMARLSFVEGTKPFKPRRDGKPRKDADRERPRGPWLSTHPRIKQISLERYSFTGNGKSDSATTEWLVWAKVPILNPGGYTAYGYKGGDVQRRYVDLEATA